MKKQLICTLFLFLFIGITFSQNPKSEISYNQTTKRLEFITSINSDKQVQRINLGNNKYFLLDFSIPGCRVCVKDIPKVIELSKNNSNNLDVVMLWSYVNYDTWMMFTEKLHSANLSFQVLLDEYGITNKTFDIEVYPTYMLFDTNGQLVKKWQGRLPKKIEKYIEKNSTGANKPQ